MPCARTLVIESSEAVPIYEDILHWFKVDLGLFVPQEMKDVPALLVDLPTLNDKS